MPIITMWMKASFVSLLLMFLLHSTFAAPVEDIGKFPLRFCYINPCQFAVCPAFPDAKCRDCGCSPRWLLNGFDVTKNFYECPDGFPPVNCFIDPCEAASCPNIKGARCVADYCGGCNARWYLNGREVTKYCEVVNY